MDIIEHDAWAYGLPKLRSAGKITLPPIPGVLPFTGVRNPISTSNISHKSSLTYKTAANQFRPKVGLAESAAELAVAEEALIRSDIYDVEFQPISFQYQYPTGSIRSHTIDLRFTFKSGRRRLVFVRNSTSLIKPWVQEEIAAIRDAAPAREAHEFIVVDADAYCAARKQNLSRMHRLVSFQPDPVADQIVEEAAIALKTLWRVADLQKRIDLAPFRVFQSCLRLIAAGKLGADLDAVVCEHSRIWVVKP